MIVVKMKILAHKYNFHYPQLATISTYTHLGVEVCGIVATTAPICALAAIPYTL